MKNKLIDSMPINDDNGAKIDLKKQFSTEEITIAGAYYIGAKQPYADAKALTNFMFREIVEDAHSEYNISQEDMEKMCQKAMNRAALYIKFTRSKEPEALQAFRIFAYGCEEWEPPKVNAEIKKIKKTLMECLALIKKAQEIMGVRKQISNDGHSK